MCYFQRSRFNLAVALVGGLLMVSQTYGANVALIIANSGYNPPLPGVILDLLQKNNALKNADWTVDVQENRTAAQMIALITANAPASGSDRYIVWYSGHGAVPICSTTVSPCNPANGNADCPAGETCTRNVGAKGDLAGVDGEVVTPAAFMAALGTAKDRTTVILDSCGSGAFADAADPLAGANPNGLAFITATNPADNNGLYCTKDNTFTACFVRGLNGAADGADADSDVSVGEAGAYAQMPCAGFYDGDNSTWKIGAPKTTTGYCTLLAPSGAVCAPNITKDDCEGRHGVWKATQCIPTVSDWGLAVMGVLVLTAATVVIMRRRAMVRGGS